MMSSVSCLQDRHVNTAVSRSQTASPRRIVFYVLVISQLIAVVIVFLGAKDVQYRSIRWTSVLSNVLQRFGQQQQQERQLMQEPNKEKQYQGQPQQQQRGQPPPKRQKHQQQDTNDSVSNLQYSRNRFVVEELLRGSDNNKSCANITAAGLERPLVILMWNVAFSGRLQNGGHSSSSWSSCGCRFTADRGEYNASDAVVFAGDNMRLEDFPSYRPLPRSPGPVVTSGNPTAFVTAGNRSYSELDYSERLLFWGQKWIYRTMETPTNTAISTVKRARLRQQRYLYNLTSTFSSLSDIPTPYFPGYCRAGQGGRAGQGDEREKGDLEGPSMKNMEKGRGAGERRKDIIGTGTGIKEGGGEVEGLGGRGAPMDWGVKGGGKVEGEGEITGLKNLGSSEGKAVTVRSALKDVENDDEDELLRVTRGKTRPVAWFVTHCWTSSKRERYVRELQRYIDVDVYGGCGRMKCPLNSTVTSADRHRMCDSMLERNYFFYLSFENSLCQEYITEKFWRLLHRDVIAVTLGGANYVQFVPDDTFIDIRQYDSPQQLAEYLRHLASDKENYVAYLRRKRRMRCRMNNEPFEDRLCRHLSENWGREEHANLDVSWNARRICYPPEQFYKGIADMIIKY